MNTFYQWLFGAHQYQADVVINCKPAYALKICCFDIYIFAILRCAGITGCDKKLLAFWTLSYFPGEGALPAAGTK